MTPFYILTISAILAYWIVLEIERSDGPYGTMAHTIFAQNPKLNGP